MGEVARRLGDMRVTCLLQFADNFFGSRYIDTTGRKVVSTVDGLVPRNFNESDRLGVTRFETDRCACRDVQTETICFGSIELKLRIGLNEVIV